MEVTIGLIIVAVFLIVGWQQLKIRRPASDKFKDEADALITKWAQERKYLVLNKTFVERQWGSEKRLFYDVSIQDAAGNQRTGMAICVLSNENPERGRVDIVWKQGQT